MKKDGEIKLLLDERAKGKTQEQAAARAGMSVRTARKYERAGQAAQPAEAAAHLPHAPNPFADDWPWVVRQLERDPALQATTLFGLLGERAPGPLPGRCSCAPCSATSPPGALGTARSRRSSSPRSTGRAMAPSPTSPT